MPGLGGGAQGYSDQTTRVGPPRATGRCAAGVHHVEPAARPRPRWRGARLERARVRGAVDAQGQARHDRDADRRQIRDRARRRGRSRSGCSRGCPRWPPGNPPRRPDRPGGRGRPGGPDRRRRPTGSRRGRPAAPRCRLRRGPPRTWRGRGDRLRSASGHHLDACGPERTGQLGARCRPPTATAAHAACGLAVVGQQAPSRRGPMPSSEDKAVAHASGGSSAAAGHRTSRAETPAGSVRKALAEARWSKLSRRRLAGQIGQGQRHAAQPLEPRALSRRSASRRSSSSAARPARGAMASSAAATQLGVGPHASRPGSTPGLGHPRRHHRARLTRLAADHRPGSGRCTGMRRSKRSSSGPESRRA